MKKELLNLKNTPRLRKAAALFMLYTCFTVNVKSQTAPAWVNFASPADYANYDVKEVCVGVDTAGNVYTAGSAFDTIHNSTKTALIKYNSAGVQQWASLYDNTNLPSNSKDVVALLVDKAGNSYLCGYAYTSGGTTSKDYMLMKYNTAGVQQWVRTYDGGQGNWDYITCATFDAAGNIVVGGYVNDNGGATGDDIGVVKYGTSGTQMWTYQYNNPASNGEDRALGIATDANNNIFITGSTYGTNARDMITLKLNSSGVNQWTKIVPHVSSGNDEHGYSIAADAAGNSYATGVAGDWITTKYDPSGTVLWTNHYLQNGLNGYNLKKVMLDKNNNVITVGDVAVGGGNGSDLCVNKLSNATGISLWSTTKNNAGTDVFTDACLDDNGNVYVGGYFEGPLGGDISAMIVSSGGGLLWNSTYSNPNRAIGDDRSYHVAIDQSRNFYLAGLAERRGVNSQDAVDIVTLKYSALVTGINENTVNPIHLSIYPNPAKDNLTINFTEQSLIGATLSITNLIGQVVKAETLTRSIQTIDIKNLPKGIYMVNVASGTAVASGKLIIE